MKRILILGAGTAGTMVANRLRRRLDRGEWQITVVDDFFTLDGATALRTALENVDGGRVVVHITDLPIRGKLAFRWIYWHLLLPGRRIPLPAHMSMAGKQQPVKEGQP